jgi:hypothetical protein
MNQFKLLAIVYLLSAIKLWSTTKFSLNRSPLFSLRCQRFQETLDFEISSQQHFVRANLEVQSRLVLAMQKESLQRSVAQLQAMRVCMVFGFFKSLTLTIPKLNRNFEITSDTVPVWSSV